MLLKINILYRFPTFNIILANILVTRPVICTLWIFNTCTLLSTSNMKELGNSPLDWGQLRKIFSIDSTLNLIGIERTPEYTSRLHFSEVESTEKNILSWRHQKWSRRSNSLQDLNWSEHNDIVMICPWLNSAVHSTLIYFAGVQSVIHMQSGNIKLKPPPKNSSSLCACHLYGRPPLPIHSGVIRGIPVQNMGTFRPIPVEYCPGGGDFPSWFWKFSNMLNT